MSFSPRDSYLSTEVRTAAPQKLQWFLVDAALRSANRARQQWQLGQDEAATESLMHAQRVLGEMLAAVDPQAGGDLARRVSAVYEFIFRSLVAANQGHDEKRLADAIRILEIERETWKQLGEQIASHTIATRTDAAESRTPPPLAMDRDLSLSSGGFSIEA